MEYYKHETDRAMMSCSAIKGMFLVNAEAFIKKFDLTYRVTKTGTNSHIVTRDFKPSRINIELDNDDIVVKAYLG